MKKRLLALSMMSLVTLGSAASCSKSPVKWEEGVILKIGDNAYTFEDAYRELAGMEVSSDQSHIINSTGAEAYYNVVNNVLIQLAVPTSETLRTLVEESLNENYYQKAKDNASSNGTTAKEERQKILENEGVKNVDELRAKYLLQKKQDRNSKAFYSDANYKALTPDFVNEKSPYHVRHILVKVDSTSSLYRGSISKDNANKIFNVVRRLTGVESFGQVAKNLSDDSSASDYGDVGIMHLGTSFVSEFKYSLYGYDAYFNENVDLTTEQIEERLSIPSEAKDVVGKNNFGIPLSAVLELAKYADTTKSEDGLNVDNSIEANYPRNIIFNQYFNNHATSYIYLDQSIDDINSKYADVLEATGNLTDSRFKTVTNLSSSLKTLNTGIASDPTMSSTEANAYVDVPEGARILCDDIGRPIIVTRAGTGSGGSDASGYQGIHFIVAQRSPFVDMESEVEGETVDNISEYYKLDIPSTTAYDPTAKPTFINYIKSDDRQVYEDRAKLIRKELESIDNNMEFRIFESNLAASASKNITINPRVEEIITRYISTIRENAKYSNDMTYRNSWESFLELLELQQSFVKRVLPSVCIKQFNEDAITKGGQCDVTK